MILLGYFAVRVISLEMETTEFSVVLNEDSNVYDGDTIEHCYVKIKSFDGVSSSGEVLWPGILLKDSSLFSVTNIRVAGVDTPERHPKKAGRSVESLAAEKAAALVARQAVLDLLDKYNYEFTIEDPFFGKYAGRVVASVYFGQGDDRISLSDYLIDKGLGYAYDGGEKRAFDSWFVPAAR